MAEFKLDFGATVDVLTKGELRDELKHANDIWYARALGLKHLDMPVLRGTPNAGALTLGGTTIPDQPNTGPRQGYVWRVVRISVAGLGTGDVLSMFKGDPGADRFLSLIPATAPMWSSSHAVLLKPGAYLTFTGSGLTAAGQVVVSGEVYEAPAEMVFKLIGG